MPKMHDRHRSPQGVQRVAKRAGINRVTVYKTLKPETESSFTVMRRLLAACGVSLTVQPDPHERRRAS